MIVRVYRLGKMIVREHVTLSHDPIRWYNNEQNAV